MQGMDQLAKLSAARNNTPFDVVLLPTGPMLQAADQGLLQPIPAGAMPNLANVPASFQRQYGPDVALQIVGIAYNPATVKTPPTSWAQLWDKAYVGKVGLPDMSSGLGMAFVMEVARSKTGNPYDMDAAFAELKKLLPSVATISDNPATLSAMFQQGEVDIAPQFLNEVEVVKAKGVALGFVRPDTGWAILASGLYVPKGSAKVDLAAKYIDAALDPGVQLKLAGAPNYLIPTNSKVPFSGSLASIAKNMDEMAKNNQYDWQLVNKNRPDWLARFNKEIKS
jgi:putative spermidine/putrescine transport system substrate-binding protein